MRAPTRSDTGWPSSTVEGPVALPRLLDGCPAQGFMPLPEHLERYGRRPDVGSRRAASSLIEEVERSGLRGRGGSGFPMALKLRAVARGAGPRFVVANGMEGEPMSAKDATLAARLPHLLLDGLVIAAQAVGAQEGFVAVERSADEMHRHLRAALAERRRAGVDPIGIEVVQAPSRYVAGEESALINFLNGHEAKPTAVPPRPFERGVRGKPTLVQNVETLAHLGQISRFGADWYRELGSSADPGSTLVTVSGAVARSGILEVEHTATLQDIVAAAGGPTRDVAAFLVGGYFGTWLDGPSSWSLSLGAADLHARGASLGCGVVYVLPVGVCGLGAVAPIARYLADETAGQCGPCVHGLASIAHGLDAIAFGPADPVVVDRLKRWLGEVAGRGACRHPDGASRFVASALEVFAPEIESHRRHRRCLTGEAPLLPVPTSTTREWGWR